MPNHVTNYLEIIGSPEDTKALMDFMRGDDEPDSDPAYIDFNKIIPMPEELDIESGGFGKLGYDLFHNPLIDNKVCLLEKFARHNESDQKKIKEQGLKYKENLLKYGCFTWYDWCTGRWGTKWNGYKQHLISDREICFDTAWSAPIPVIRKLSELFPQLAIHLMYADEDTGYNCGMIAFKGGVCIKNCYPDNGSKEACSLAYKIRNKINKSISINNLKPE